MKHHQPRRFLRRALARPRVRWSVITAAAALLLVLSELIWQSQSWPVRQLLQGEPSSASVGRS